jgi:hypothetical protein
MSPSEVEVLKSPNDRKSYRRITLESGLVALLIHDPEVAAALAADPKARPASAPARPLPLRLAPRALRGGRADRKDAGACHRDARGGFDRRWRGARTGCFVLRRHCLASHP